MKDIFKTGDLVYCPTAGNKIFTLAGTHSMTEFVLVGCSSKTEFCSDGKVKYSILDGGAGQSLFHATEENRIKLEAFHNIRLDKCHVKNEFIKTLNDGKKIICKDSSGRLLIVNAYDRFKGYRNEFREYLDVKPITRKEYSNVGFLEDFNVNFSNNEDITYTPVLYNCEHHPNGPYLDNSGLTRKVLIITTDKSIINGHYVQSSDTWVDMNHKEIINAKYWFEMPNLKEI